MDVRCICIYRPCQIRQLYFDLWLFQAILTHKGRSSNSGHYVAWVKHKADTWIECNDDDVRPVHVDDVMKLSGGGKTSKNISLYIIHGGKRG